MAQLSAVAEEPGRVPGKRCWDGALPGPGLWVGLWDLCWVPHPRAAAARPLLCPAVPVEIWKFFQIQTSPCATWDRQCCWGLGLSWWDTGRARGPVAPLLGLETSQKHRGQDGLWLLHRPYPVSPLCPQAVAAPRCPGIAQVHKHEERSPLSSDTCLFPA